MILKLQKSIASLLRSKIEKYDFEVGILDDKPHKDPVQTALFQLPQLKRYAGGPIRPMSRITGPFSISEILIANSERLNIDLLREPFRNPDSEIMRFSREYLRFATGRSTNTKRIENLLQAIVRNPILRQEYGDNTATTADNKGFDRHLFDTGQMFKAIRAKVNRV